MARGGVAVRDGTTKDEDRVVWIDILLGSQELRRVDRTTFVVLGAAINSAEGGWSGEGIDDFARRCEFSL